MVTLTVMGSHGRRVTITILKKGPKLYKGYNSSGRQISQARTQQAAINQAQQYLAFFR